MLTTVQTHHARRATGEGDTLRIRRLVVPLDGSPLAERALELAIPIARLCSAEVTLVRALSSIESLPSGHISARRALRSDKGASHLIGLYLARKEEELRLLGIRVSSRIVPLLAADAILDVAVHSAGDLVVMSSRAGAANERDPHHESVAAHVVDASKVPVLLVGTHANNPFATPPRDGLRIALDDRDAVEGTHALQYALAFANAFGGLVRVVSGQEAREGDEQRSLAAAAARADLPQGVVRELLRTRASEDPLTDYAREHADLVVVGRRIRRDPTRTTVHALTALLDTGRPMLFVP